MATEFPDSSNTALAYYDRGRIAPGIQSAGELRRMRVMTKQKREVPRLAAGELELLQMLWRAGGVTILEAQHALGLPIGYTTVQTRLNRLVKKGVAVKSKERPAKYSASLSPVDVQRSDLDLLVQRVSNGQVAPLVAHLVNRGSCSREEIDELKRLVANAEKRFKDARKKSE